MTTEKIPPKLDIERFAREGGELSGALCLKDMPRLLEACVDPLPEGLTDATPVARWHARGGMRPNVYGTLRPWLFLHLEASLPVRCERCLQAVAEEVNFDFEYRFVATEEQAIQEDSESEEVVLATSKTFDLLELCEDELIMAIPYMPLHEQCPSPLIDGLNKAGIALQVVDEKQEEEVKENPFAVLEQLKKNLH